LTFISLCAMPTQIGYEKGNYGFYGGFEPAPRTSTYSGIPGARRHMVMRDTYYGSRPRSGTWERSPGGASGFRPKTLSIASGGFARPKRAILDDDVEMITEGGGTYRIRGRGRYQRKRMYKRRRFRRY